MFRCKNLIQITLSNDHHLRCLHSRKYKQEIPEIIYKQVVPAVLYKQVIPGDYLQKERKKNNNQNSMADQQQHNRLQYDINSASCHNRTPRCNHRPLKPQCMLALQTLCIVVVEYLSHNLASSEKRKRRLHHYAGSIAIVLLQLYKLPADERIPLDLDFSNATL
jgi:hypothetical protein